MAVPRTPRGIKNNNPANLRLPASSARPGYIGNDKDGFGIFELPQFGLDSLARQLVNYGKGGLDTAAKIISRWAPPSENNTLAYVEFVAKRLQRGTTDPINMKCDFAIASLMDAIIRFENGIQPYPRTMLFKSAQSALTGGKK
mgnify:CR=1 FL=1